MSKISLDLKKFKHIKSDDDTATLRHVDGHELTIAKKSLSPHFQQQLEAISNMAEGGKVPQKTPELDKDKAAAAQKGAQQSPLETLKQGVENLSHPEKWYSKGGKVKNYIEGQDPKHLKGQEISAHKRHKEKFFESEHGKQALEAANKESDKIKNAKMAHGGKIKEDDTSTQGKDVRYANKHKRRGEHDEHKQAMDFAKSEARGRAQFEREAVKPKLKGLAEGGPVHPSHERMEADYAYNAGLPCKNPNCKSQGKSHPNCRCYSSSSHFAEGGEVDVKHVCEMEGKHYPDCEYYAEGSDNIGNEDLIRDFKQQDEGRGEHHAMFRDDAPESEEVKNKGIDKEIEDATNFIQPQMQEAAAPLVPEKEEASLAPEQAQPASETPAPEVTKQDTDKGVQLSHQGEGASSSNPIERFAQHKQTIHNDYANEDAAWAQDLANGHITPLTYGQLYAKKDTLGKIGTIFGLLLSGAGSGLANQPNALLHMMDQTIANDLEAQKTSKANAVNHLRLAQQHEMNKANINSINASTAISANTLARMRMNREALHSLVLKADALPKGSPEQKQAYTTLAMLNSAVQNENNNLADRAATAGAYYDMLGLGQEQGAKSDDEQAFQSKQRGRTLLGTEGAKIAQYDTERHIPGIKGSATDAIPQHIRDQVQAQNVLDNKVRDVLDFAQKNVGSLNPKVIAQAKQKAEELTAFYNKSVDNLGMTQGRLSWLEEQIKKNPTSIIQQILGNNARLAEIRDSNVKRKDLTLKNLGFKREESKTQEPEEQMSKSGKPMIKRDGKWYYK